MIRFKRAAKKCTIARDSASGLQYADYQDDEVVWTPKKTTFSGPDGIALDLIQDAVDDPDI